jgi:hypothetical protein
MSKVLELLQQEIRCARRADFPKWMRDIYLALN